MSDRPDIRSLEREGLASRLAGLGVQGYRLTQVLDWLYSKTAGDWSEMTNVPQALRETLSRQFTMQLPEVVRVQGSGDTTRKFLWKLRDGSMVESVLIPANPALYGESSDRFTLCVSTQVGCAYGCKFCASGLEGWKRNLTVDEIVGQVVAVERWYFREESGMEVDPARERLVNNLVIMGMGEPLANYDALMGALRILNASWGMGIGARKITVSTSGLAPEIRRLGEEPFQFGLAISLHGATDEVRQRLMPVNRKYPLSVLTAAVEEFLRANGRTVTLEYILIEGVNDGLDQIRPLAQMARQLRAKVNLIPYNKVDGLDWRRPNDRRQQAFLESLTKQGVRATLRREKGHDIDAACGQLRLRTEKELAGLGEGNSEGN